MCPLATSIFMTNSLLLWLILGSVGLPLQLAIKLKVVKEVLQWRSELRAPAQSYVIQADITSELNLQCNYFTVLNGTFVRRTANLEKLLTYQPGADPGGAIDPPKTYKSNFFHHNFVQFGNQHSRYKAILSSIVLSQQCYEVYFISLTVAKPLWDLTTWYYWNRPV